VQRRLACSACESIQVQSARFEDYGGGVENPARGGLRALQHTLTRRTARARKNKHTLSKNGLQQLALGLRENNAEFQVLYS